MAVSIGFDIYAKDRASKTFRNVGDSAKHSEGALSSMGSTLKKLAGAFVAFEGAKMAVNAITDMAKAAIDDQQSSMLMAKGLQNSAHATKQQIAATEDWITKQGQAYGVADDDLRPALTRLATATHSVSKAQRLASLAMDISAGTGKSLKTVTEALMKAQNGSVGGLSRLGAKTKDAAGKTMSLHDITKSLAKTYGGDAATKAGTFAGKMDRLKLAFSEAKESVGYALLPILSKLMTFITSKGIPAIQKLAGWLHDKLGPPAKELGDVFRKLLDKLKPVGDWMTKHPAVIKGAAIALGIAAVAAGGLALAMGALAVATSPITLTVLAIAALGGAIAYAYKHSASFRDIVHKLGDVAKKFGGYLMANLVPAVERLAKKIGNNLKPIIGQLGDMIQHKVLPTVKKLEEKWHDWGPTIKKVAEFVGRLMGKLIELQSKMDGSVMQALIKFAGFVIGNVIPAIIHFIQHIVDAAQKIGHFVSAVKDKVGQAITFIKGVPGKITSAIGNLGSLLYNAGRDVIQGLINGISSMIGNVTGALHHITSLIPLHKGPPAKDRILLKPAGVAIMQGLVDGIRSGEPLLKTALGKITGYISAMGSKLSDLLSQRQSVVDSFRGFTTSVFGTDLSTQNDDGSTTPATVASMLAYQQAQAAKAAQTRSDVARLIRAGLSKSLIAQMQQSGESGMAQLHTLAGATPAQIRALNQADAATNSNLSAAGMAAGNALFAGQIDDTQRDLKLAKTIARELGHVLHQHAKDGEIHIHLEGQTIVETIRKHQRKQGKKPTV